MKISGFQGMIPRLSTEALPPHVAVLARNCEFQRGRLEPAYGCTRTHTITKAGDIRSIYKLGATWLAWIYDVDVIRAQSTATRIYFSGDGYPRSTDEAQAIAGGVPAEYPSTAYRMGVVPPTEPLNITITGTAGELIDSVAYCYTLVSRVTADYEEESAPSPVTAVVDIHDGQTVTLSNFAVPPDTGNNVTHYRVYRSVIGSNGQGDFYLVPFGRDGDGKYVYDLAINQTELVDYDGTIGRLYQGLSIDLETEDAAYPPDALTHLVQYQNGVAVGLSGREVRFSKVFKPYQMPEGYSRTCSYDPVATAPYRDMLVVGTTANPTVFGGSDPAFLQQQQIPTNQGCKSRWMVPTETGVVYSSPDGLAICDGVSVAVFSDLYTKRQWQALDPSKVMLAYYDGRIMGFWRGTGTGFRYDFRTERFLTEIDLGAGRTVWNVHGVPEEDALYLLIEEGGAYYVEEWDTAAVSYTYTGRWNHAGNPFYTFVRLEGDGPVTLDLTLDGELFRTLTLNGEPQWITPGPWPEQVEYTLTGTGTVEAIYFADTVEELYER